MNHIPVITEQELHTAMRHRAEQVPPVAADFTTQVARKMQERRHKRFVRRWLWIGSAAAVTGVALLIAGLQPSGRQEGEALVAQVTAGAPAPVTEQRSLSPDANLPESPSASSTPAEKPLTYSSLRTRKAPQTLLQPEQTERDNPAQTADVILNAEIAAEPAAVSQPSAALPTSPAPSVDFTPHELELMRRAERMRAQTSMYIEEAIRVNQYLDDDETPATRST